MLRNAKYRTLRAIGPLVPAVVAIVALSSGAAHAQKAPVLKQPGPNTEQSQTAPKEKPVVPTTRTRQLTPATKSPRDCPHSYQSKPTA